MTDRQTRTGPDLTPTLRRKIEMARLALGIESLWPLVVIPAAIGAAFVASSWFGLFTLAPGWLRIALVVLFALPLLAALWRLIRWQKPDLGAAARRLDLDDPALHRPLATLVDRPASTDPVAAALWAQHRARAEARAERLKVAGPVSRLPAIDRFGLAALSLLLLTASAFVAGDERLGRLSDAVSFGERAPPPAPPRLDAWIDPPTYTGRAPIFLSGPNAPVDQALEIPAGSSAMIRVSPGDEISATSSSPEIREVVTPAKTEEKVVQPGGLVLQRGTQTAAPLKPGATFERRFVLSGPGLIEVKQGARVLGRYDLKTIPDLPPTVDFEGIEPDDKTQALKLRYRMDDDYGIAKSEALIGRADRPGARTLLPPPDLSLGGRSGEGEALLSAPDHAWAGARITIRLRVSDDVGQMAESQPREAILPMRRFENPVSKALVEQRRMLIMTPDDRRTPQIGLDSLLVAPERFTRKSGDFIMLSMAARKLRVARSDADLVALAQFLWDTAVALDGDSDLSDAERALRAAEERLREALERGAPPDEVRKLMEEMRQALNEVLRERMEQAERNGERGADQNDRNRMTLTQRDLNDMLKRIEELYRQGDTARAQELLRQLQEMMKSMQSARRRPSDQRNREMGEAMDELDKLQREQEQLRDENFRNEQKRRMGKNQPRRDQQQGQRGQQQQQGDQSDDDDADEDGDQDSDQDGNSQQDQNGMQGQQGQNGQGLTERQQALRNRLKQLRDKLRRGGVPDQEGFEGADESMGDATENLKRQQGGRAGQDQQRAIDELGKAGRGLSQQMQREMREGQGMGEGEGPGEPDPNQRGRAEQNTDPLGRPLPQDRHTPDNSRVKIPTGGDVRGSISERAQRVLEELRRRLGEPIRPREELDYLERLLRQR